MRAAAGNPVRTGRMSAEYQATYEKRRSKLLHVRARKAAAQRKRRLTDTHRVRARELLKNALEKGAIKRLACFVCGELKVQGHHVSYDLPLDVVWLCKVHHKEVHAKESS
jgi:hypothetical protein